MPAPGGLEVIEPVPAAVFSRSEALDVFYAGLAARLKAGQPVAVGFDPFLQFRGPAPGEPVTVYLPAGWSGRP
jgi:hypothetical protein